MDDTYKAFICVKNAKWGTFFGFGHGTDGIIVSEVLVNRTILPTERILRHRLSVRDEFLHYYNIMPIRENRRNAVKSIFE